MAAREALDGEPDARERAVPVHGLRGVQAAARQEAAVAAQQR